jgi:CBS domain-containing protein
MRDATITELIHYRDPLTLPPEATVQEACRMMRSAGVGCVLVTDSHNHLLGIFTGRDAIGRIGAECVDPAMTTLSEVMTPGPATLGPEASGMDALRLMQDGGFRHVPLVRDGVLVGVVSRGDFRAMQHARLNDETGLWECMR